MEVDLQGLKSYVDVAKNVVDLMKSAYAALPKGQARDEIENKVKMAEQLLRRSDAKLAADLGYNLCQCEFPPRPMLWRERENAWVCQNEQCGRRAKSDFVPDLPDDDDWIKARR